MRMRGLDKVARHPSSMISTRYLILLGFILVAMTLWLRAPSTHHSVIDHDESTYIVIAESMLRGSRLYVDVWDTKPAGIFLLFSIVLKTMGGTIESIRNFGAICIALSAWLLLLIRVRRDHQLLPGILSALCLVTLCSVPHYGLPSHIELFFSVFTAAALWIVAGQSYSLVRSTLFGLLFGLGFIIKPVILFDLLPLFFWLLLLPLWQGTLRSDERWRILSKHIGCLSAAFLLPFIALHAYYLLVGHFDALINVTYLVPSRYVSHQNLDRAVEFVSRYHHQFWFVLTPFYLSVFTLFIKRQFLWGGLLLSWYLMTWLSALLPGKYFTHYLLQLALPVSLCAPDIFSSLRGKLRTTLSIAMIASLCVVLHQAHDRYERYFKKQPDVPKRVAAHLKKHLSPDDRIYTANFDHILYHLLDLPSPTPYIHRSLLTNRSHIKTLQINPDQEIQTILSQRPRFILTVGRYPNHLFMKRLKKDYRRVKVFHRRSNLYERRSDRDKALK